MLEMTKPLYGTGKVVVADSGFCVRDGVVACHNKGVHVQAYVKKRGHWPKGVPGDHIDNHLCEAPSDGARRLSRRWTESAF